MIKLTRFLLPVILLPWICAAEEKCPWLNAATAEGALGGPVQSHVTQTACEFVRRDGRLASTLRIEVETMAASGEFASRVAQCGSGVAPVKAIGNEAVACSHADEKGHVTEQVVGRVRNQAFLVRISTNDRSATSTGIREQARKIAEQIAGFLF